MGDLNFRGIKKEVSEVIRQHKIDHDHKNMTQALECIISEWAVQRKIGRFDMEKAKELKELLQKCGDLLQKLEELSRKIEELLMAHTTD